MMRKRTRERLSDFGEGPDGKIEYQGATCRYVSDVPLPKVRVRLWAQVCLGLVAAVAPGFMPVAGLVGTIVTVVAYVAQLVAMVTVVWALARLTAVKASEPVRVYVREETADAIPRRALVAAGIALLVALSEVSTLIMGLPLSPFELAFLACEAICMVCLVQVRKSCELMSWQEEPGKLAKGNKK